jgi:hypothetical protein
MTSLMTIIGWLQSPSSMRGQGGRSTTRILDPTSTCRPLFQPTSSGRTIIFTFRSPLYHAAVLTICWLFRIHADCMTTC